MLQELCLLLLVCLTFVTLTEADPCDRNGADGCSIPGNLPFPYKHYFRPVCNKHDICYFCGKYRHVSRKSCDSYFLVNMWKKCKWWQPYCKRIALVYYTAVRVKGATHYKNPSPFWCNQNWVPSCMR